ncbi:hypothetical protein LVK52_26810, partial [Escherichia coli]|uniref:hypothetical protein n=1 Tax=Escherichia coli TaxID=562 RepID=UPI00263E0382
MTRTDLHRCYSPISFTVIRTYRYNALNAVTEVVFTGDRGGEIRHRLARDAAGRLTAKETAD